MSVSSAGPSKSTVVDTNVITKLLLLFLVAGLGVATQKVTFPIVDVAERLLMVHNG